LNGISKIELVTVCDYLKINIKINFKKMELENFDKWNNEKKEIHKNNYEDFFVNKRDIYFTKMWLNIGFEENWKKDFLRPVLVLKKVWNLFFTISLTSQWKDNNQFYYKFKTAKFNENNKKYENSSYCILSQVKVMDKKRFTEKMWYLGKEEFDILKEKLKEFLL